MSDAPDPPPPEPMSQAEQVFAFKQDLEALVDRYSAEMTMCYIGALPLDEDGEDEDQPEDWQQ